MKIKKKKLLMRALHALASGCCLCLLSGTCSVVQQLEFPNRYLFWSVRWRRSCWGGALLKSWRFSGSWVFSPSIIFSLISLKFTLGQPKIKVVLPFILSFNCAHLSLDGSLFVLDFFLIFLSFNFILFHLILFSFYIKYGTHFFFYHFLDLFFLSIFSFNIFFSDLVLILLFAFFYIIFLIFLFQFYPSTFYFIYLFIQFWSSFF